MELRKRVRYRLAANAVFTWEGAQRSRLQGAGVTRDISVANVFILTPTCPPVEATIQLDVFLPPLHSGAPGVQMKTEARVIRVQHANGREGFAAEGQGFTLPPALGDEP